MGYPGSSNSKESTCNAGDLGLIPGLGRFPGGGNGTPLQCSCLKNPMDRGAWQAAVQRVAKSQTRLSDQATGHKHTPATVLLATQVPGNLCSAEVLSATFHAGWSRII